LSAILGALKQSPSPVFDVVLLILCGLIVIHGIIGVCFAISTDFNITKMLKEKALLYLQILSALGATFVIIALTSPTGKTASHSGIIGITGVLAAVLGSFHIANGFVNACITLGISVSQKTKFIVKILSWIIAVFSMIQIIILFL
jgi:succinate dehydrogenase/fumarate reductase cytochrome b subunit